MAQVSDRVVQAQGANTNSLSATAAEAPGQLVDKEKVLPLPEWLKKMYFIFPVILYIPDIIFNYYVYSDGWKTDPNPVLQVLQAVLVAFLSVGIVGMAYLLSVLAPWHWGQGHKIQALFCGFGVVVATAITTWNSLSYRSTEFVKFPTDEWVWQVFPDLKAAGVSLTMVLVAVAPPFWGLFWALVQPTETGRTLAQLNESHQERLLRMQQEAEVKRLRAETNAKIREAQLRGMAATMGAAREQATGLIGNARKKGENGDSGELPAIEAPEDAQDELPALPEPSLQAEDVTTTDDNAHKVLTYPQLSPSRGQGMSMMNSVAPAAPSARVAPANAAMPFAMQSALLSDADVDGTGGMPTGDAASWVRRPPTLDPDVEDAMTGTTGPRQAVRKPFEPSPLMSTMNERVRPEWVQAYNEAMKELNPTGKRKVTAAELTARVAEKLNMSTQNARTAIARVREIQRPSRA
jgi:hypothetical protein